MGVVRELRAELRADELRARARLLVLRIVEDDVDVVGARRQHALLLRRLGRLAGLRRRRLRLERRDVAVAEVDVEDAAAELEVFEPLRRRLQVGLERKRRHRR